MGQQDEGAWDVQACRMHSMTCLSLEGRGGRLQVTAVEQHSKLNRGLGQRQELTVSGKVTLLERGGREWTVVMADSVCHRVSVCRQVGSHGMMLGASFLQVSAATTVTERSVVSSVATCWSTALLLSRQLGLQLLMLVDAGAVETE